MKSTERNDKLICEEQRVLDDLVDKMELVIDQLDDRARKYVEEAKTARNAGIHDNYFAFLLAKKGLKDNKENRRKLQQARDELYDQRVEVYIDEDEEPTSIQIGDTSFVYRDKVFVAERNRPICRPFWGGEMPAEFEFDNYDENGKFISHVKCKLKKGRNIELRFSKVMNVVNAFPLSKEEQDELVIDILTQELLERRSDNEWKSILRSIQKKQKEIVLSPLDQNIIVQGCAGSGKTMIMLHRLPIVLMDNPKVLSKNTIYVITPSKTYIQLAQEMISKYDIADVNMGILKEYYDFCIDKYNHKSSEYGEINPSVKLSEQQMNYVYSEKCICDICESLEKIISIHSMNMQQECRELGVVESPTVDGTVSVRIQALLLRLQKVIGENERVIEEYYKKIRTVVRNYQSFSVWLGKRKSSIVREIRKLISKEVKKQIKAEKELAKFNKEDNKIAYENRQKIIADAIRKKDELNATMKAVENDTEYFKSLTPIIKKIENLTNLYNSTEEQAENHIEASYALIGEITNIVELCEAVELEVYCFEDKYYEYGEDLFKKYKEIESSLKELMEEHRKYVPYERYLEIKNNYQSLVDQNNSAVFDTYFSIMQKLGVEKDDKGKFEALECSPYIYLQTLYQYAGRPNGEKESLITIDEAQGVAAEEIRLIRNVNGDRIILNLFGDVRQHIEGTKGLDSWNDLDKIMSYNSYELKENYRNAKQITDYCNQRLNGIEMKSMNTAGRGVHEMRTYENFVESMEAQFMDVNRIGLAAIVVKDIYEADFIKDVFSNFEGKLFDMTGEEYSAHRTRWNILTVEAAKGLEFTSVVVLSGRMTPNEKYIAYTRALDELFIYDEKVDISVYIQKRLEVEAKKQQEEEESKSKSKKKAGKDGKKSGTKADTTGSKVKEFFENKGLEVIDNRDKRGHLWVLGERGEIQDIVNQAIKEFNLIGSYKASKETNSRKGWCTKTKK